MISTLHSDSHSEMLIEAQGQNLRSVLEKMKVPNFSRPTILKFGIQLLDLLETLHKNRFVHGDLKIENFVIGVNDPGKIYLIDFGLAHEYVSEQGVHIVRKNLKTFSGNFLFASLNSCRGYTKSRRDDIESLLYLVCYYLNNKYLPWCDLIRYHGVNDLKTLLRERLNSNSVKSLVRTLPSELKQCLNHILCLHFEEAPNYKMIRDNFYVLAARYINQEAPVKRVGYHNSIKLGPVHFEKKHAGYERELVDGYPL